MEEEDEVGRESFRLFVGQNFRKIAKVFSFPSSFFVGAVNEFCS